MDRVTASELASNDDRARLLREREARRGERTRARCKRCRKAIPPEKRRDAVYCSDLCKHSYRWELDAPLVREVRVARRLEKVFQACTACGGAMDASVRPGPVPKTCGRCYHREYMRRRRAVGKTQSDTLSGVTEVVRRFWRWRLEANGIEVTPESDLRDGLGLDSLDLAELVMECEQHFRFRMGEEVPDARLADIVTVADLAREIDAARAGKGV